MACLKTTCVVEFVVEPMNVVCLGEHLRLLVFH